MSGSPIIQDGKLVGAVTEMGKVVPVLRNGVDEIYVMDYEAYLMRKESFLKLL